MRLSDAVATHAPERRESPGVSPTSIGGLDCHTRIVRVVRSPVTAVVSAIALAVVAMLLLLPTSGVDTQPPVCWAAGGYEVTCSQAPALGTATVILVVGGLVAWRVRRSNPERAEVR